MATYKYLDKIGLEQVWGKIKTYVAGLIPHPNWGENDNTSANYITNRTHWKEDESIALISEQTVNVEYWESEGMYYTSGTANTESVAQLNQGTEIHISCQGNDYVSEIVYIEDYKSCDHIDCTDYMIGLSFSSNSFSINFYYSGEQYNVPQTITISATAVLSTFHQLDNRYLNGKLIQSGTGTNSEIFNDYTNGIASGSYSHAEGQSSQATGEISHAEGSSIASGSYSHAESSSTASGNNSHSEGYSTASGGSSHAEGRSTASGSHSHSEGYYTTASGSYSHAEGRNTTAQRRSQHVFGEYNILDAGGSSVETKGSYIEIVGNGTGTSASKRSNARTLDWSGNEVLAGKLTVGAAPTNNMDVATKQYVDTATASITDEKLSTGTIGNNVYYPIVGDNTASATTKYIDSTGLKYDATSSTNGYARLYLGNGTASGTEGSKYGRLMIYGTTAYAVTLDSGSPTENRSISLPNKNGTVALTSDVPTKTSDLTNDSGFMTGMTILSYGSSTWANFIDAYTNKKVVYCRASSNSNPASGSQTRLAFMAYVNDAENPTNVEFQYYRSVSSHSNTQQGDQVYVYKLDKSSGWSVTVRENYTKVVAGTGLTSNWASGAITLSLSSTIPSASSSTPQDLGTASAGSSTDYSRSDHVHALPTLSISSNVITLTGASGQTTSVALPVYNGGVSSS